MSGSEADQPFTTPPTGGSEARPDTRPPAESGPAASFRHATQSQTRGRLDDDDNEKDLWEGGYSAKAMFGTWILAILVGIGAIVATALIGGVGIVVGLIVAALVLLLVAAIYAYRRLGVHYKLTSQRFIHQTGVLHRVTDRIEVIDIDDVAYSQGPVQRMLGVGTIRIDSSDKSHPQLTMLGIDNVKEVAGLIDDIRRSERRRRSVHIESI